MQLCVTHAPGHGANTAILSDGAPARARAAGQNSFEKWVSGSATMSRYGHEVQLKSRSHTGFMEESRVWIIGRTLNPKP